jgi:hypothetical protein
VSFAEIKASIAEMSLEERLEIAAFTAHLNRTQDPDYQAELDRRMTAMDAGHKSSANELQHLHDDLSSQGR